MCVHMYVHVHLRVHLRTCVCVILQVCVCYVCLQAQYVYAHECIKVAIEGGMHLTGRLNGPVHGNCVCSTVCSLAGLSS